MDVAQGLSEPHYIFVSFFLFYVFYYLLILVIFACNFYFFLVNPYNKLGSEDKHRIEEAIYDMMETFKITPLDIFDSLPRRLYSNVEKT